MKWKRRYVADLPDLDSWQLAAARGHWALYRSKSISDGWRNYRLLFRRPARMRVSFSLGWHVNDRRFAKNRDHSYLAHRRGEFLPWVAEIASREPDQLALDTNVTAGEQTAQRLANPAPGLRPVQAGEPRAGLLSQVVEGDEEHPFRDL